MVILDEVLSNIIRAAWPDGGAHAATLDLAIAHQPAGRTLVMQVMDDGIAFDPTQVPPPDLTLDLDDRVPGGLGLFMVREMSDHFDYLRKNDRNCLLIKKVLQE
jgi:serine/threonine-protein kinase RsbW